MNRNPKNILFLSIALACALSISSCSKDQAEIERPEKVYYDQAQRRIKVNNYFVTKIIKFELIRILNYLLK